MVVATVGSDWAQVVVTALLGAVTAFLGLSLRRKRREETAVSVAENRLEAYAALWSHIPYSTELLELVDAPPLGSPERRETFDAMTAWYYAKGGGLLLSRETRAVYLPLKKNLICRPERFVPASLAEQAGVPARRSELVVRQLSLLRAVMRADLEVYGKPWGESLKAADRDFLYACGVPGWRVERTLRERLRWVSDRLAGRTKPSLYLPTEDESAAAGRPVTE